jgi:transketolase
MAVTPLNEPLKNLAVTSWQRRITIMEMVYRANSGHIGGAFSWIDYATLLFSNYLRHDAKNPKWEGRDRFILSKGHACAALYVTLSGHGYFPHDELYTFRALGSRLQGHPEPEHLDCLEVASGSLGQGLSVGVGMALGLRLKKSDARVFVVIGDGEQEEGQIWEAAMAAGHHKLENLVVFADYNGVQQEGLVKPTMDIAPLTDKWRAFNWRVLEADGHNFKSLDSALKTATDGNSGGKPTVIVAATIKGKGVSFMESNPEFHGKAPSKEQYEKAQAELNAMITKLQSV